MAGIVTHCEMGQYISVKKRDLSHDVLWPCNHYKDKINLYFRKAVGWKKSESINLRTSEPWLQTAKGITKYIFPEKKVFVASLYTVFKK